MNPFQTLLSGLTASITERVASEVKAGLSPVGPYLRHLALGTTLILVSVFGWTLGLVFLLLSFFYLAQAGPYTVPALITGLICFLIALVLTLLGVGMVRRPR